MKVTLVQCDADDVVIAQTLVDTENPKTFIDAVLYYDTNNTSNKKAIYDWVVSGKYKTEFLSISGESEDGWEDDFFIETMYLSVSI